MAIPEWLWPNSDFRGREIQRSSEPLETSEIEDATTVFEVLSNTTRLEILVSLHDRSSPITYTELRDSISIDDKGKLNYHLRQLDRFVHNQGGSYTLSERGEELFGSVLSEGRIHRYE